MFSNEPNDGFKQNPDEPILDGNFNSRNISCLENYNAKQFSHNDLELVEPLGNGNFGRVDKYQVKDQKIISQKFVAVKNIKYVENDEDLKEIRLLVQCKHRNIIHCFGFFIKDKKMFIVTEFMPGGDLREYLLNAKNEFTFSQALNMFLQICNGMQYLIQRKILHRDLAARNCLMSAHRKTIKITDFGLGRKLYDKMYYRPSLNKIFPIKWTALECLEGGKFTEQSDVWSFGVLMWEVLSRQKQPYSDVKTLQELIDFLKSDKRLSKPYPNCMNPIYELMCFCWNVDVTKRPTFSELYKKLKEFRQLDATCLNEKIRISLRQQMEEGFSLNNISELNNLMDLDSDSDIDVDSESSENSFAKNTDDFEETNLDLDNLGIKKHDRNIFELTELIAEGAFGTVNKCKVKDRSIISNEFVAIKNINKRTKELKIQGTCKHKNIVELLGYYVENQCVFIVMKYLSAGNLHDYLVDLKNKFNIGQAFDMMMQVVDGMEYLHSKNIIFRALTAFSCMFSAGRKVIKLNGFALSRKLNSKGYYHQTNPTKLDFVSAAVECFTDGKYTKMSDVWSFGVVLWMVFSRETPYFKFNFPIDVNNFLTNGERLRRPIKSCSLKTYELMLHCWDEDPMKRPTFKEIRENIEEIMEIMENYGEVDEEINFKKSKLNKSKKPNKYYMSTPVLLQKSRCFEEPFSVLDNTDTLNENIFKMLGITKYDINNLKFVSYIENNSFGMVSKYQVKNTFTFNPKFVAVKKIEKESYFHINEIKNFGVSKHKNIVKFLGYNEDIWNIFIVMEYLPEGNLSQYLLNYDNTFNIGKAFEWLLQIIKGMQYLHDKGIIHRNLVARNCMLSNKKIKIDNFGLSRDVIEKDFYSQSNRTIFHFAWTAMECLWDENGTLGEPFTKMSDVWSFGVLFWEVFARREPKLQGHTMSKLKIILSANKRLRRPSSSPSSVYNLMRSCWFERAENRPKFKDLWMQIHKILSDIDNKGEVDEERPKSDKSVAFVFKKSTAVEKFIIGNNEDLFV